MVWRSDVCYPVSDSYVAEALLAQSEYAAACDSWHVWLESPGGESGQPTNAEQLLLCQVIRLTEKRRSRNGEWSGAAYDFLPDAATMASVLDREKIEAFEREVAGRRERIERAAKAFVALLESPEMRTEFQELPELLRLTYGAQLADGLALSNVGLLHLRKALHQDQSPLPVLHPEQLRKNSLTVRTALTQSQQAARAYGHIALNILPSLVADENRKAFNVFSATFLASFVPEHVLDTAGTDNLGAQAAAAHRWLKANDPWFRNAMAATAAVQGTFDVIGTSVAVFEATDDPSPDKLVALARSLTDVLDSASTFGKYTGGKAYFLALSAHSASLLARFNLVCDVWIAGRATFRSAEAAQTGDYSVAAGEAMQAVGLAAAAVLAVLVPGAGWVAAGAIVLSLAGSILAAHTVDTRYEQWLQNCWFGDKWNGKIHADPTTPMYGASRANGTPDIWRQVSEWVSMLSPIDVTKKDMTAAGALSVECTPSAAYSGSYVVATRIAQRTSQSGLPYIEKVLVSGPVDAPRDGVEVAFSGDRRVAKWKATLDAVDLYLTGDGTDPGVPPPQPSPSWIEIAFSTPTRWPGGAETGPLDPDTSALQIPLMARVRVEAVK